MELIGDGYMGGFYHGWRRKIGVAALVLSCVFAGGWIRSLFHQDSIEFIDRHRLYCVSSGYGYFGFKRFEFPSRDAVWAISVVRSSPLKSLHLGWSSSMISEELGELQPWRGATTEWHLKWQQFLFGTLNYTSINQRYDEIYAIAPYWSIVIPLTLLSAYLLLSKPRIAKPPESC